MPMTVDQFAKDTMLPAILAGIKRGSFDFAIPKVLAEHANGEIIFDNVIIEAMRERLASAPKAT